MKKLPLSLLIGASVVLSGCTTYDAYTGEQKTSKTSIGAGIGAGVAAVIAYIDNKDESSSRKRNQRILAAAGGGALAGGGVGYYMDNQEAKLRQQLRGTGVSIQRNGDNINLVMPSNITFAVDSSQVNSSFYNVLNSVSLVLKEYNKTLVVVSGHTDSTGSETYNQNLSERRAHAVADYLKSQGILNERFDILGFGETKPVADNSTAAGRDENRRVEITLLPITETTQ